MHLKLVSANMAAILSRRRWVKALPTAVTMHMIYMLNSLWPSSVIWQHKSGSILAKVRVCCRTTLTITCTNVDLSSKVFPASSQMDVGHDRCSWWVSLLTTSIISCKKIHLLQFYFPWSYIWIGVPSGSCFLLWKVNFLPVEANTMQQRIFMLFIRVTEKLTRKALLHSQ